MKYQITAALIFLSMTAATANAVDIITFNDETPARGVVITHDGEKPVFMQQVIPMKLCQQALEENFDYLKSQNPDGVTLLCIPADLTKPGVIMKDLPIKQFTK